MLLNNLHALRVHTQGLFEDMGGEEVSHRLLCGIYLSYMATYVHGIVQRYTCVMYQRRMDMTLMMYA